MRLISAVASSWTAAVPSPSKAARFRALEPWLFGVVFQIHEESYPVESVVHPKVLLILGWLRINMWGWRVHARDWPTKDTRFRMAAWQSALLPVHAG